MIMQKNNEKKKVIIENVPLTQYGKESVVNKDYYVEGNLDRLCYSFKVDELQAMEFRNFFNEFFKPNTFTKKFFTDESCNYLNFKCKKPCYTQGYNDGELVEVGDKVDVLLGFDEKGNCYLNGIKMVEKSNYNPFDI